MLRILQYYGKFQGVRGNLTQMPGWARAIVAIVALPGLVLVGLSILAVLGSILALLLLTVPVYRLLSAVTSPRETSPRGMPHGSIDSHEEPGPQEYASGPRRHIDVKIIE
jgi:hypothetical protein